MKSVTITTSNGPSLAKLHTVSSTVSKNRGSSLKTGPARLGPAQPGHVKIALDITAVDIDIFFLYSTGTMIMYDSFSL